jgi:hypothetical protein
MSLLMSRTGNASTPAYDAAADLAHVERELITVMYVLGMATDDISSSSFDDIVAQIKATFPFLRLEEGRSLASNDALKEVNVLLMVNVRRLWHRWQVARSIVNG